MAGTKFSPQAELWAMRALSPCDERLGGTVRIPDLSTNASAALAERLITVIAPPTALTAADTWNCAIYTPPIADVAFIYQVWKSTDPRPALTRFGTVVGYTDVAYATVNVPLEQFADTTFCYPGATSTLLTLTEQFRQTHKGLTVNLNASALNDQGMVISGQWGDRPAIQANTRCYTLTGIPSAGDVSAANNQNVLLITDLPVNTAQLYAKDPNAVRAPAKEGVYMPLKFNDPVQTYTSIQSTELKSLDGATEMKDNTVLSPALLGYRENSNTSFVNVQFFQTAPNIGNFSPSLATCGSTNMQSGLILFEGLSPSATLDVKTVAGVEVVTNRDSAWNGFMMPSPIDNEEAQKQVHAIQARMPSAFPASYNFIGTLLTTILPALGSVATSLITGFYNRFVNNASQAAAVG